MEAGEVLAWLERRGTRRTRDGMARYGIEAKQAFGVPMRDLLQLRKRIGTDQALSLELWETDCYEARLLAALVGDPARVTRRQMNAWAAGFENWADCDTACFHLFDRAPFAWQKAAEWASASRLLTRRGGFALMACLALHDREAPDRKFAPFFPLIEDGAEDERHLVMMGVRWAMRALGGRNASLNTAAVAAAKRLVRSDSAAARSVGKGALRELQSAGMKSRIARKPPAR